MQSLYWVLREVMTSEDAERCIAELWFAGDIGVFENRSETWWFGFSQWYYDHGDIMQAVKDADEFERIHDELAPYYPS